MERLLHNIANDGQFFPWLASVNKPVEIFTPLFSIGFCQYKWLIMQTMHHWPLWLLLGLQNLNDISDAEVELF